MSKFITVMGEPNELGYDMSNVIVGDPMANVIVGYDDELGVSFFKKIGKGLKKVGKGVGSVAKTVTKPIGSVVKIASTVTKIPGVGVVFAAAGPAGLATMASIKIVDQLQKGTPQAKAAARVLIRNTKRAAAMGNPQAVKGLNLIRQAARRAKASGLASRLSGEDELGARMRGMRRPRYSRSRGMYPIAVEHTLPGPAMSGKLCMANGVCINGTFVKVG